MFEKARYTTRLRRLHWLMALLVALTYIAIEQRGLFPRGSTGRFAMMQSHFWLGIGIFILVWIRLQQRLKHGVPRIAPALPAWQKLLSQLFHLALYAFFILMPILGILTANFDGKTIYIPLTEVALPTLVGENEEVAHQLEALHGQIGDIFYWIIGIHIVAALYHHFIRKDDTLNRMV